jgi:aryl-alcohol dehydrogenase-like predicted oxidoreductase
MRRKIGNSDVTVTPVTFGAWAIGGWMWGGTDEEDAINAIQTAIANGMTSIDTAPIYGFGHSETLVGKAIKGYDRSKLQILTKFGMIWEHEKGDFSMEGKTANESPYKVYKYAAYNSVLNEVENSLKRLQTDYIDLIQLHWPDITTPIEETMRAMDKLLQDGKVRAIGVCNYDAAQLAEAEQTVKLQSNQVPYSMLNRKIENEVIPYALQYHLSVIAYSPMERGLLTGKFNSEIALKEGDHRAAYFKKFDLEKVKTLTENLAELGTKYKASAGQMALAWTFHQPALVTALAGARNAKQAEENAAAMAIQLSQEDLKLMNSWME